MSRNPGSLARRFLCPVLPDRGPAVLPAAESRHLTVVMRAGAGTEFEVVDGRGKRGRARLVAVRGGVAEIEVLQAACEPGPAAGRVALAAAVPKGNRADWMIQKAVEAGLDVFFPLLTRRGVATAEGAEKRSRWDRVAAEAAKQSGRAGVPELLEPRPLAQVLEETAGWPLRLLAEAGGRVPGALPRGDAAVFVGPEGGWAPEERALLAGMQPIRLAPYTLRIETAAVLGVAALANRE